MRSWKKLFLPLLSVAALLTGSALFALADDAAAPQPVTSKAVEELITNFQASKNEGPNWLAVWGADKDHLGTEMEEYYQDGKKHAAKPYGYQTPDKNNHILYLAKEQSCLDINTVKIAATAGVRYVAPADGAIDLLLSDAFGDGNTQTAVSLYSTTAAEAATVKFAIYHNGTQIWPQDEKWSFTKQDDGIPKIDLQNVSLKKGDRIDLLFDYTASTGTEYAHINPAVTFTPAPPTTTEVTTTTEEATTTETVTPTTEEAATTTEAPTTTTADPMADATLSVARDALFESMKAGNNRGPNWFLVYGENKDDLNLGFQNFFIESDTKVGATPRVNAKPTFYSFQGDKNAHLQITDSGSERVAGIRYVATLNGKADLELTKLWDGNSLNGVNVWYDGTTDIGKIDLAIYQNGEQIWPAEGKFVFDKQDKQEHVSVKGLTLSKGDAIDILFGLHNNQSNAFINVQPQIAFLADANQPTEAPTTVTTTTTTTKAAPVTPGTSDTSDETEPEAVRPTTPATDDGDSAKTGDSLPIAGAALLLLSAGAAVLAVKRSRQR